ncbi:MAG: hypothetical protein KY475_06630 [Planctomycetes bacterium]|nr:hypothetical protein [Planctomycetota bacterium]
MDALSAALALCLSAAALTPAEEVAIDQVDLVEVNHFYDEHGRRVFDQVIFYDWSPGAGRYQVRAWRLLKSQSQFPIKNWERGDFTAVWHDGEVLREVRAASFRETWTQYDPELVERDYLPKDRRRELMKPVWVR